MKTNIIRTWRNNLQLNTKNYKLTNFSALVVNSNLAVSEKKNFIQNEKYMTSKEKKDFIKLI